MTDIQFLSEPSVELVDSMGSDQRICDAARVSTGNVEDADPARNAGLIRYLMEHRHGSPFEHGSMTFRVKAQIFVAREFMRHRIGWSYNEMSGRYTQLLPEFYVPAPDRPLVNVGTSARPEFEPGDEDQVDLVRSWIEQTSEMCWVNYQDLLGRGIANEVARMVLPVNIMTQFYATCNPRSLMAFLSLRVDSEDSTYRSRPQLEIQQVAQRMEDAFALRFPLTYEAFVSKGRVGP